jgi:hypothetical protein
VNLELIFGEGAGIKVFGNPVPIILTHNVKAEVLDRYGMRDAGDAEQARLERKTAQRPQCFFPTSWPHDYISSQYGAPPY